jgi:transposase InsO family protein
MRERLVAFVHGAASRVRARARDNTSLPRQAAQWARFPTIFHARAAIESWRIDYNTRRPHTSLTGLAPTELIEQYQTTQTHGPSRPDIWGGLRLLCGQRACMCSVEA